MENNDLVSIIVPIYNCETVLKTCLDSILKQNYSNLEIILINDGSTDQSLYICYEYKNKDSRISVIDNKNRGVSFSRNCGIQLATGNFICFVDSDDWLAENYIFELISSIKSTNADVSICNFYCSFNGSVEKRMLSFTDNESYMSFLLENNCWAPWGKMFKKEIITDLFDEKVSSSEDLLFNFKNSQNIKKFSFVDICLYFYRKKDDNKFALSKIGDKQTSELDALIFIIENISVCERDYVICHYISTLHRIIYYKKRNKVSFFANESYYLNKSKEYYKSYLNKSKLSLKKRIKNFIIIYLSNIYYLILDIQIKTLKYR